MPGTLYIVATPIGNLEDMSARALRILTDVTVIACEDTRNTGKLLKLVEISTSMLSVHQHTDERRINEIVQKLREGADVAYVSDAGTPGVNDPGGKLVDAALEAGIVVSPIPGPSALTAAISVCGFPMDEFTYYGFVPHKKGRETLFKTVAASLTSSVLLESTHRIMKTLESLAKTLAPSRRIFVGRELTKMHETLYRGTVDAVIKKLQDTSLKGEFVIIISPS